MLLHLFLDFSMYFSYKLNSMSNGNARIVWASNIALGTLAFFTILYLGRSFFIPVAASVILALAIYPLVTYLERKLPRVLAILLALLFIFLVLSSIITLVGFQISGFVSELPAISRKLEGLLLSLQDFIDDKLQINPERQFSLLKDNVMSFFDTGINIVSTTINVTSGIAFYAGIMPVYIFFMIYYREIWTNFLVEISPVNRQSLMAEILGKMSSVIRNYVGGMLLVMIIVSILNTIGFAIIGLKYSLFFGAIIAFLAIIPFFGIMIGSVLAVLYSFISQDSLLQPLGVIIVTTVVQFLEGNFITPTIMRSQVQLNPLVAIMGLLFGGFLWGGVGMILSIPTLAILKMVLDSVDSFKPYGRLLGVDRAKLTPQPPPSETS